LAKSYYAVGEYSKAVATTARCMERPPLFPACLVFRAVSLGALGQHEEAHAMIERLMEIRPNATLESTVAGNRFPSDPELNRRLTDGLRAAGLGAKMAAS
jgi:tetratricopeptide (TPR) repeat protein